MTRKSILALALAALVSWPGAKASVVITGTRVVFPSDSRDVSIRLSNNGETPALVQTWVDAGDTSIKPEDLDVPFSVSPSIFRIEPARTQVARLVFLGAKLPQDRESVYWLNVLEIPPKAGASTSDNYLQFAIKSRIKIFYRPGTLRSSPDSAPSMLKWTSVASPSGDATIAVENPSPFYVSFAEVRPRLADGSELSPVNAMVAPFGTVSLNFKLKANSSSQPTRVLFKTVNDYGSFIDGAADLQ